MITLVEKLSRGDLSIVPGARISALVPLSEKLLNELAQPLVDGDDQIHQLRVEVTPGNRLLVHLKAQVRVAFVRKNLDRVLQLAVPPHVDMMTQPVLRLRIVEGIGTLEGILLDLFKKRIEEQMPDWVHYRDEELWIFVPGALAAQGMEAVAPFIKSLDIRTESGRLWIQAYVVS